MSKWKLDRWCVHATKLIKYPPDREAVRQELWEHLCDSYDEHISRGMEHDAAVDEALRAMGDADEVAPMLGAIHRPFWAYFLNISKVLLIAAVCVCIVVCGCYIYENPFTKPYQPDFEGNGYVQLHDLHPKSSVRSQGYTFTVEQAKIWRSSDSGREECYITLEVTNPLPWAPPCSAVEYFYVIDDLGNYYQPHVNINVLSTKNVVVNWDRTGLFTYTYTMSLWDFSSNNVQWLQLCYDRSGRDLRLHIDLSGGDPE